MKALLLGIGLMAVTFVQGQVSSVTRPTIQRLGPDRGFFFPTNSTGASSVGARSVVFVPRPPVDPEKTRQERAETLRKTVAFQTKRAREGSAIAQYDLGIRHLTGDGVEKNPALGLTWLKLAADQTNQAAIKKIMELKATQETNEPVRNPRTN